MSNCSRRWTSKSCSLYLHGKSGFHSKIVTDENVYWIVANYFNNIAPKEEQETDFSSTKSKGANFYNSLSQNIIQNNNSAE